MFRVILEKKADADEMLKNQLSGDDLSDYYTLHLEKLIITNVSQKTMSSRHLYLIQSPICIYLWLGQQVEPQKKKSSLRILQNFCKHILDDPLMYRPGYHFKTLEKQEQNILTVRLRIEYEGYESRQCASLLGKIGDTPGNDSRIDYLMLRLPKLTAEEDEENFDSQTESLDLHSALESAFSTKSAISKL